MVCMTMQVLCCAEVQKLRYNLPLPDVCQYTAANFKAGGAVRQKYMAKIAIRMWWPATNRAFAGRL
jgi:hypothetical protein